MLYRLRQLRIDAAQGRLVGDAREAFAQAGLGRTHGIDNRIGRGLRAARALRLTPIALVLLPERRSAADTTGAHCSLVSTAQLISGDRHEFPASAALRLRSVNQLAGVY